MKDEYYLAYRTVKGDENSAEEAILFGYLTPEMLDALEVDLKERNAADVVGELVLNKRNRSQVEKKRFETLTVGFFLNRGLGKGNLALTELKNHYLRECNIGHEEAEFWMLMTGQSVPPEHHVLHTIEEIRRAKSVVASIPTCSDANSYDDDAMMEYVLRLIWLYEFWLPTEGYRWSFTICEMFLYLRRCLAWMGNNYSDEKIHDLLKGLNTKHGELIQPEQEHQNEAEYRYELTDLGRIRATGSIKSLLIAPGKSAVNNSEPTPQLASKPKNKLTKPRKPRKKRQSKYEDAVRGFLDGTVKTIKEMSPENILKIATTLSARCIAAHLNREDERFTKTTVDSIEDRVRRTDAWRDRKKTHKTLYDTQRSRNRLSREVPLPYGVNVEKGCRK